MLAGSPLKKENSKSKVGKLKPLTSGPPPGPAPVIMSGTPSPLLIINFLAAKVKQVNYAR